MANISASLGQSASALDNMDMFIQATVDAALASQAAATAAESLGLGICYIGATRNNSRAMSDLLGLPPRVFAVFGLVVGKPDLTEHAGTEPRQALDELAEIKPRLAMDEVLHRERWDNRKQKELVASYDKILGEFYYDHQKHGRKPWSHHMSRLLSSGTLDGREATRKVLEERGFGLL